MLYGCPAGVLYTHPMKANSRTVKLKDEAHTLAANLSTKFGISMAALVEIGIRKLASEEHLTLPPRDPRSKKLNSRSLAKAGA